MADETTTGSKTEVSIDNSAVTDKRKKLIKTIVIGAVVVLVLWFVYKKFLK